MTQLDTSLTSESPSDATATATPAPVEAPVFAEPAKPDLGGFYRGTGRRKSSVARVRIRPAKGEGTFVVNGKDVNTFFTQLRDQNDAVAPLRATSTEGKLDVIVKVHGGGYTGQSGAVVLGLARALKGYDPTLEPTLREHDFLTRDDRKVERKKPGQPGARKRFQFSKR